MAKASFPFQQVLKKIVPHFIVFELCSQKFINSFQELEKNKFLVEEIKNLNNFHVQKNKLLFFFISVSLEQYSELKNFQVD